MSNVRLQINPHNKIPTFLMYSEEGSITEIEVEEEEIYIIRGMTVEYLDGNFYGLVGKPIKGKFTDSIVDEKLVSTGIRFSPHEIDQILYFMDGDVIL